MKKIYLLVALATCFLGYSQSSLEFSKVTGDGNPAGNGPVVTTGISFLNNTNNPGGQTFAIYNNPGVTATFTLTNQTYDTPLVAAPAGSILMGYAGAASGIFATGDNGWFGDSVNGDFTSVNATAGNGIARASNYAVSVSNFVRPIGNGFNLRTKQYTGRLEITFSRPVTDPVIHVSGLGGNSGTIYYANTLDLNLAQSTPNTGISFTRLSGDTNFVLLNTNTSISNSFATPAPANGTAWHSSGSVRINGTNIQKVSFDLYIQGYAGNTNATGYFGAADTNADTFGLSLSASEAVLAATNDAYGAVAAGTTTATSVFANDTYNGAVPTASTVTVSAASPPAGFTVNPNGTVTIASTVTPGSYNFNYTICDVNSSGLCRTANATFTVETDSDGDGVPNSIDLDDDNDGILDNDECVGEIVTNGTFNTNTAGWTLGQGWAFDTNAAGNSDDNITGSALSQTVNNLSSFGGTIPLKFTISAQDFSSAAGRTASLNIILNGVTYGTINNSAARATGTNNITLTTANGATSVFAPFSTAAAPGFTSGSVTLNIPYTGPSTATLSFSMTSNGDDWRVDDVSILSNCDTDNDGIVNSLDLDSDGDGCYDAIEGDEFVKRSDLDANGRITGGVNASGVPIKVNSAGSADIGGDQGQGLGDSQNSSVSTQCLDSDGDGIYDTDDLDDDNDGIPDCDENRITNTVTDGFKLNGNASVPAAKTSGNNYEVQLTPNSTYQAGQMWSYGKVDFSSSFVINMRAFLGADNNGADGIAIVFQNSAAGTNATGGNGQGIGAEGIANGIALELDTFQNTGAPYNDPAADHGAIWLTQTSQYLTANTALPNLEDNVWHNVVITWDVINKNLNYTVDGTVAGTYTFPAASPITNVFGGNLAYFGYTGSTGGSINDQRIAIVNPCTDLPLVLDSDNDGIPNQLDLDSDGDGCFDAIEGDENVKRTSINGTGRISGAVDASGVPVLVNSGGSADIGGDQGQGFGDSQNTAVTQCLDTDGDGTYNSDDLDDDNDGILDIDECKDAVVSADFSAANGNTYTFTAPSADLGFVFDIYTLDNSFSLTVNGTAIASSEIDFQSGHANKNIRFTDGSGYGIGAVPEIWNMTGSATNPLLRLTIHQNGFITMMGSKTGGGPLLPLELYNGTTFNNIVWKAATDNVVIVTQSIDGATYITGHGTGYKPGFCDPDGDGISNQLDLDSDGDGCFDAVEGDENVYPVHVNTNGSINTSSYGGLDANGVPNIVNAGGIGDIGGDFAQGFGDSQNSLVNGCFCYKPGATTGGTVLTTNNGVTSLQRAGSVGDNWPMIRNGGWTALEALTKGFVVNRLTSAQITALPSANLVEGMMVYNVTLDCLQINTDGTAAGWKCFNDQTCTDF